KRVLTAFALAGVLSAPAGVYAQTSINILTGARNDVSRVLAVALSQIYTKAIPNIKATANVTKTPAESLMLLQGGRGELAFAPGNVLSAAWRGDEAAGFKMPLDRLRGLSATYDNYVQ